MIVIMVTVMMTMMTTMTMTVTINYSIRKNYVSHRTGFAGTAWGHATQFGAG